MLVGENSSFCQLAVGLNGGLTGIPFCSLWA